MNRRPVLGWPRTRGRVWLVLVLGVVAASAAAGAVWASIPDANGVIHGCFKTVSGQLRIVQSAADCNPAETAIAWNQTGPPGPPPPVADRTLWISPLAFQAGQFGGNLTFDRGSFGDTLTIGSTAAGDLQWVNAPLSLPSDLKVKQVTVCYSDASAASFISQVRLAKETVPPSSLVVLDDPTDLTSTAPVCASTPLTSISVDGAFTLSLRMNFASTSDTVSIGAVGIKLGA